MKLEINNVTRVTISFLFYITYIIIINSCIDIFSCSEYLEKEIRPLQIDGQIISIDLSKPCVAQLKVETDNDQIMDIVFCICRDSTKLEEHLMIGTIIKKDRGSLLVRLENNSDILEFKFPCCDG